MARENKPTIYTIADAVGVAPSTVSRALNPDGRGRVGKETARLIFAKAAELGYQPNQAAASLRTNRTATFGLVVPRLTDQVVAVMAESAEDTARQAGYQLVTTSTRDRPERELEIVAFLRRRDVDGFILATATREDRVVEELARERVPFVLLNRSAVDHTAVVADDELGGYLATRHLLTQGHRRIGYVSGPLYTSTSAKRLAGYRRAHEEVDLPVDEELVIESNFRSEGGAAAASRLLATKGRPSAIFAVTDATAIGAMAAARDLGLRVPEDLAVVGYNDSALAALLPVPLTSVSLPLAEMGSAAVELLVASLAGQPIESVLFTPHLIVRASTAGRRSTA